MIVPAFSSNVAKVAIVSSLARHATPFHVIVEALDSIDALPRLCGLHAPPLAPPPSWAAPPFAAAPPPLAPPSWVALARGVPGAPAEPVPRAPRAADLGLPRDVPGAPAELVPRAPRAADHGLLRAVPGAPAELIPLAPRDADLGLPRAAPGAPAELVHRAPRDAERGPPRAAPGAPAEPAPRAPRDAARCPPRAALGAPAELVQRAPRDAERGPPRAALGAPAELVQRAPRDAERGPLCAAAGAPAEPAPRAPRVAARGLPRAARGAPAELVHRAPCDADRGPPRAALGAKKKALPLVKKSDPLSEPSLSCHKDLLADLNYCDLSELCYENPHGGVAPDAAPVPAAPALPESTKDLAYATFALLLSETPVIPGAVQHDGSQFPLDTFVPDFLAIFKSCDKAADMRVKMRALLNSYIKDDWFRAAPRCHDSLNDLSAAASRSNDEADRDLRETAALSSAPAPRMSSSAAWSHH